MSSGQKLWFSQELNVILWEVRKKGLVHFYIVYLNIYEKKVCQRRLLEPWIKNTSIPII